MFFKCNCISDHYLHKRTNENTELYSLEGRRFRAKVVDIYDGDTITVVFKLNRSYVKYKVRMYGYDSPEMKPSKKLLNRIDIIANAKYAKKKLSEKILNEIIILECLKWDKYGRLLAIVYLQHSRLFFCNIDENINNWMVEEGLGKPYFGGKKS